MRKGNWRWRSNNDTTWGKEGWVLNCEFSGSTQASCCQRSWGYFQGWGKEARNEVSRKKNVVDWAMVGGGRQGTGWRGNVTKQKLLRYGESVTSGPTLAPDTSARVPKPHQSSPPLPSAPAGVGSSLLPLISQGSHWLSHHGWPYPTRPKFQNFPSHSTLYSFPVPFPGVRKSSVFLRTLVSQSASYE